MTELEVLLLLSERKVKQLERENQLLREKIKLLEDKIERKMN